MKDKLLVLAMTLLCAFGLTACGAKESAPAENLYGITDEDAASYAESVIESVRSIVDQNMQAQYEADVIVAAALKSWSGAADEMGEFVAYAGHDVVMNEDGVVISSTITGTEHDVIVEITLDEDLTLTNVAANVQYSFGELMKNAALNTVLGMGTVFIVLILISLIIYCFSFIPKVQEIFSGKKKKAAAPAETAAPAPVQTAAVEEDLTDDCELVAVIAAAIAASEGAVSTDGFVVRSIRRKSNWKANN